MKAQGELAKQTCTENRDTRAQTGTHVHTRAYTLHTHTHTYTHTFLLRVVLGLAEVLGRAVSEPWGTTPSMVLALAAAPTLLPAVWSPAASHNGAVSGLGLPLALA